MSFSQFVSNLEGIRVRVPKDMLKVSHTRTHACMHTHTHMYTQTHTHTHTHTHTQFIQYCLSFAVEILRWYQETSLSLGNVSRRESSCVLFYHPLLPSSPPLPPLPPSLPSSLSPFFLPSLLPSLPPSLPFYLFPSLFPSLFPFLPPSPSLSLSPSPLSLPPSLSVK